MDEVNSLIRNLVSAESTKGNIRMKYITEMIINIKMLDIISSDIRDFCPESKKHINNWNYSYSSWNNSWYYSFF